LLAREPSEALRLANPDLPRRLKEGLSINPYRRDTFILREHYHSVRGLV
jgi:hypothetical protein